MQREQEEFLYDSSMNCRKSEIAWTVSERENKTTDLHLIL